MSIVFLKRFHTITKLLLFEQFCIIFMYKTRCGVILIFSFKTRLDFFKYGDPNLSSIQTYLIAVMLVNIQLQNF